MITQNTLTFYIGQCLCRPAFFCWQCSHYGTKTDSCHHFPHTYMYFPQNRSYHRSRRLVSSLYLRIIDFESMYAQIHMIPIMPWHKPMPFSTYRSSFPLIEYQVVPLPILKGILNEIAEKGWKCLVYAYKNTFFNITSNVSKCVLCHTFCVPFVSSFLFYHVALPFATKTFFSCKKNMIRNISCFYLIDSYPCSFCHAWINASFCLWVNCLIANSRFIAAMRSGHASR